MQTYKVIRQHYGDKQYWVGDERDLGDFDAKRLLAQGVIADKKAPEPSNKRAQAPKNKAEWWLTWMMQNYT